MTDLLVGYAGFAITFVIFAFILLLIFVKANNISLKTKLITIPIVLLYSIILYYTPGQFMGYASEDVEGIQQVIVLGYHVVEDDGIYFMILDYNRENIISIMARPSDAAKRTAPRLYKIPYNSDVQAKLDAAWQAIRKSNGRLMMSAHLDKLKGLEALFPGEQPFDLLDPAKMLKKEPEE